MQGGISGKATIVVLQKIDRDWEQIVTGRNRVKSGKIKGYR